MPFTPAHPAIVLPLLKAKRVSALALVTGSIAPDFEYFFKMKVNSYYSHTVAGLFYFDLPVAFLLGWLFVRFVKDNLLINLPPYLQRRLQPISQLTVQRILVRHWFIFAFSALLGSLSHLLWDGFTHNDTFFVRNLPFYEGSYVPYQGVRYPLWYALQHISSAVGLTIVLAYVLRLPAEPVQVSKPSLMYWLVIVAVTALMVTIRFQIHPQDLKEGNVIVSVITGLCCGLVIAGMTRFGNVAPERSRNDG